MKLLTVSRCVLICSTTIIHDEQSFESETQGSSKSFCNLQLRRNPSMFMSVFTEVHVFPSTSVVPVHSTAEMSLYTRRNMALCLFFFSRRIHGKSPADCGVSVFLFYLFLLLLFALAISSHRTEGHTHTHTRAAHMTTRPPLK